MKQSKQPPRLTVFAGPNGSGKSTVVEIFRSSGEMDLGTYINADDIAKSLAVRLQRKVDSDLEMQAAVTADAMRFQMIEQHQTFSTETVMSSDRWIEFFDAARSAGFHINLVFVTTDDPDTNVARVMSRVSKGGHDVQPDKIIARYHRTMNVMLPAILQKVDTAYLFDNTGTSATLMLTYLEGEFYLHLLPDEPTPAWVTRLIAAISN